ncbi:hypothetical protein EJ05DRAFT_247873 [Pseudovirgaria hyperparasitica]|uniref:Uncharacterized protein n=1 Tax=Pseudovirgaria hyperparasitica TaxID=470096 RepID=A0A6A6WFL5_9PEZI|nr:uncharacterized protein EJ05DRAFT_247873 [Pseudovirgaria hyperparasitica]KAF2760959.1 hypothetical protein EJ05DRAFT_247873 [Pseudovirgaria hyperparasitica]
MRAWGISIAQPGASLFCPPQSRPFWCRNTASTAVDTLGVSVSVRIGKAGVNSSRKQTFMTVDTIHTVDTSTHPSVHTHIHVHTRQGYAAHAAAPAFLYPAHSSTSTNTSISSSISIILPCAACELSPGPPLCHSRKVFNRSHLLSPSSPCLSLTPLFVYINHFPVSLPSSSPLPAAYRLKYARIMAFVICN